MKCINGHEIKPMKSAAGWYMGTYDEYGPCCRVSSTYYRTAKEAVSNFPKDYRYCIENEFCNDGKGCIKE